MYPSKIELPRSEDFCRGVFDNGYGQRCTLGWNAALFPQLSNTEATRLERIQLEVAEKMGLAGRTICGINDCHFNDKVQLARWYELSVKKLGYNISNGS